MEPEEEFVEKDHLFFIVGNPSDLSNSSRNRVLGISRGPKLSKWAVVTWQSINLKFKVFKCSTRATKATLEALLMRVNIDSPKKHLPSDTP